MKKTSKMRWLDFYGWKMTRIHFLTLRLILTEKIGEFCHNFNANDLDLIGLIIICFKQIFRP